MEERILQYAIALILIMLSICMLVVFDKQNLFYEVNKDILWKVNKINDILSNTDSTCFIDK